MAESIQSKGLRNFKMRGWQEEDVCAIVSYCHLGEVAEWSKAADC